MLNRRITAGIIMLLIVVLGVSAVGCKKKAAQKQSKPAEKVEEPEPEPIVNPLTGSFDLDRKSVV